jgi:hypothetical protein
MKKIKQTKQKEETFDDLDDIDTDSFDKLIESENSLNDTGVKELFSEKLVKARTDLSASQISKIARVYHLSKMLKMPELATLMNEFITLRISKDRQSRKEFVEGLKAKIENMINSGGLNGTRQQFGK